MSIKLVTDNNGSCHNGDDENVYLFIYLFIYLLIYLFICFCHTPRQPFKSHPSGHLGEWATPWSAEKMLAGQYQRVDIPTHTRTTHKGLLQKVADGLG